LIWMLIIARGIDWCLKKNEINYIKKLTFEMKKV
jgi:hypothetical protein